MLADEISGLIGEIYEGAFVPETWDRAMGRIRQLTGAYWMLIATADARQPALASSHFLEPGPSRFWDAIKEYEEHTYRLDPILPMAWVPGVSSYDTRQQSQVEDVFAHPFFGWREAALDSSHNLTLFAPQQDGVTLALAHNVRTGTDPISDSSAALLKTAFPHMTRAVHLAARGPVFEAIEENALVVTAGGKIQRLSAGAEQVLAQGDGLERRGGTLRASFSAADQQLQRAIKAALEAITHGSDGGTVVVPRPSGRRDWIVQVGPFADAEGAMRHRPPTALVRIKSAETALPASAASTWRKTFGLTPAEIRLAQHLLETDGDLRLTAERLGVRYSTARVHLRNLFGKTDTRNKSALLLLLQRIA